MTSLKKAVENLRPQIEKLAKDEGYYEANAKYGAPSLREESEERLSELRVQYWQLRETVTAIFSHMETETVRKALFDVFYDAWWNEYFRERTLLEDLYSEDNEAA